MKKVSALLMVLSLWPSYNIDKNTKHIHAKYLFIYLCFRIKLIAKISENNIFIAIAYISIYLYIVFKQFNIYLNSQCV